MKTHTENSSETKKEAVSKEETKHSKTANQPFQFVDNRPETIAQLKMKEMLKNSQQTMQMKNEQERPNINTTTTDELSKKEVAPFQLKEDPTGDAPPNGGSSDPNKTGLPDNLKTGMESLSGMPLDDVNVHYNSEKPAQLQALAYAQGTDIHLGPGQEEHLPHELGHVVQQKKGTVKPTMQMMGKSEGVPVNDDPQLEREADLIGGEALQMKADEKEMPPAAKLKQGMSALSSGKGPVQREEDPNADPYAEEECDPNAEPIAEEECDPNAEPIAEEETDKSIISEGKEENSESNSYYDSLLAAGMSASEMLSKAYEDSRENFMEVAERLDPSQLAQVLPNMKDIMNYFIETFWPDNTGWEIAIAGSAGGTIAGTDAGFPLDVDLGVEGTLELSLSRSGSIVKLSAKVSNAESASAAPSIKAAKLPIGITLESCDAFKIAMDLGNMNIAEHGIALLKQRNLKGFVQEAFSSYIAVGTNVQIEYIKSMSETSTVGVELGSNALASAFAEIGVKQGLQVTFSNPSETMDGKAELKGELGRHGKVGYSLLGGDDNSTELDNAILKLTTMNIGALSEGGVTASQAFGLRVTANFPAFEKNKKTNYEVAIYSNNEIGASLLGQEGKLGAVAEIVLAIPEINNFVDSLQSSHGVGSDDVAGLLPFSKINAELNGGATLSSLSKMLGNIFDEEDNEAIDERFGSINVKLEITKEKLLSIINNNTEKGGEIINYIINGEIKLAILTAIDLFSENAADILSLFQSIEIETKSSNVNSAGIITPGQGDISGIALEGSVTTSSIKKYELTRQDLNLDQIELFLRNLVD